MEQIIFAGPRTSGNGLPTNETHFTTTMVVFPPPQAKKIHLSTMFSPNTARRPKWTVTLVIQPNHGPRVTNVNIVHGLMETPPNEKMQK